MPASAASALIAQTTVAKPGTSSPARGTEHSELGTKASAFSGMVALLTGKPASVPGDQPSGAMQEKSLQLALSDSTGLGIDGVGPEFATSLVFAQPQQPDDTTGGTSLFGDDGAATQGEFPIPALSNTPLPAGKNGTLHTGEQTFSLEKIAPSTPQTEARVPTVWNSAETSTSGTKTSDAFASTSTTQKIVVASTTVAGALEQSKELPALPADARSTSTSLSEQPNTSVRGLSPVAPVLTSGNNSGGDAKGSGAQGRETAFAQASKHGNVGKTAPSTTQTTSPDTGGSPLKLEVSGSLFGQSVAEATRTPEQPIQTVNRGTSPSAPVIEQVAIQIGKAAQSGTQRISIQLDPAELGRIEVKLEFTGNGRVSANIVVERAETLDFLQRDVRGLERTLQQAGVSFDGDKLDYALRGQDQNGRQGQTANGAGSDPESNNEKGADAERGNNPYFEDANASGPLGETGPMTMALETEIRLTASPDRVDIQV